MSTYDEHQFEKIAFDLGWDCYIYGLKLFEDMPKSFFDGYEAAKTKVQTKANDRFILKWLYIRMSALRRKRIVAEHVTPKLIDFIDISICPVSLTKLTYGTGQDTDWSVDRINNDGAYAAGNICILSTRVNKIKGTLSADDIENIVNGLKSDYRFEFGGMRLEEWQRLSWLTQKCSGKDTIWMNMIPPPLIHLSKRDKFVFYTGLQAVFGESRTKSMLKRSLGLHYYKYNSLLATIQHNTNITHAYRLFDAFGSQDVIEELDEISKIPHFIDRSVFSLEKRYSKFSHSNLLQKSWLTTDFKEIERMWHKDSKGYLDNFIEQDNLSKHFDSLFEQTGRIR